MRSGGFVKASKILRDGPTSRHREFDGCKKIQRDPDGPLFEHTCEFQVSDYNISISLWESSMRKGKAITARVTAINDSTERVIGYLRPPTRVSYFF